jgi:hypothetical protein
MMSIKVIILWDVMLCSLVDGYQCFGGPFCLHIQDIIDFPEDGGSIFP